MPTTETPLLEQPEQTYILRSSGRELRIEVRGDYAELVAELEGMDYGEACSHAGFSSFTLSEGVVEREHGGIGHRVLTYKRGSPSSHGDGCGGVAVRWRLSSCPEDVSVYRYCGPSVGANANRGRIEAWRANLPDRADELEDISDSAYFQGLKATDIAIARKLLEGKEVVQRHYPMVTKTSVADDADDLQMTGALDYSSDGISGAPSVMTSRAEAWLKIQEDLDVDESGSGTLVEGWIGGASFDADFYGANRWEFGTI